MVSDLNVVIYLLIIIFSSVQAEEEWTIDKYKSLSYARVNGEVIHGDALNFFIGSFLNISLPLITEL